MKTLDDRLELLAEIFELERLVVQDLAARLAVPAQVVELSGAALALDHETDGVRRSLRRIARLASFASGYAAAWPQDGERSPCASTVIPHTSLNLGLNHV